jgi:predicted nucleic acid-binding protein
VIHERPELPVFHEPRPQSLPIEDPADNKYLSSALEAKADFIISGGHHLKDLKVFEGIGVLDLSAFLVLVTKGAV